MTVTFVLPQLPSVADLAIDVMPQIELAGGLERGDYAIFAEHLLRQPKHRLRVRAVAVEGQDE